YDIDYSHITSRQDLQLHGSPVESTHAAVMELTAKGMPFVGGGGNTYRNILVSSDSGFSPLEAFDCLPHAMALNEYFSHYEKAVNLPRKFKVGFSNGLNDSIKAKVQDMGFIAKMKNGEPGFEAYVGGGMGRESAIAVKLFDFLPENEFARLAKAILDMFFDHGDRTNRNSARLRFVLKRLGPDKFKELCRDYFEKTDLALKLPPPEDLPRLVGSLKDSRTRSPDNEREFMAWRRYAVLPTRFGEDVKSVRLFVPNGNLDSKQLRAVAELANDCGSPFIRFTQTQDVLVPLLHVSALPMIFNTIGSGVFEEIDLSLRSFKGHLTSCVGARVCKIGVADSPALSDKIAEALDRHFADKPAERADAVLNILENIRISGCHNACSGHLTTRVGLRGTKKKLEEIMVEGAFLHLGGDVVRASPVLSSSDQNFIPADKVPARVVDKLVSGRI
ncbi:MAG: nitrite/sulfite reductase, partial [Kiritimatiellaeota bacterium]|nr:nitrite/sulfite reductase [Kiritimatiellota bacterium]